MRFHELVETDRNLSFAVVGLRQGCNHIESLTKLPNCQVTAICDLKEEHIQRAQRILTEANQPLAEEYRELDEMLAKVKVDAVCLALPIPMNAPGAIKSLEAGFHTFCEKPVANRIEDALRLQEVVEKTGLIYQVGFELRHSPLIQAVMGHIEAGRIGRVTAISGYHFWQPYLSDIEERSWAYDKWGGSVLLDCMSHTFDLVNLLAGGKVQGVYADLGYVTELYANREVPEVGTISISYDNGVRAGISFTESCGMPHSTMFTVAGNDGKIEIDFANAGRYKLWFGHGVRVCFYKEESIDPTTTNPGHLGWDEQFVEFCNAILENRQPYSDVNVGIESLLVSIGAILSGENGRPFGRGELLNGGGQEVK